MASLFYDGAYRLLARCRQEIQAKLLARYERRFGRPLPLDADDFVWAPPLSEGFRILAVDLYPSEEPTPPEEP